MVLVPVLLFFIGFLCLAMEPCIEQSGIFGIAGIGFIMLAALFDSFADGPLAVSIVFGIILVLLFILYKMMKKNLYFHEKDILLEEAWNTADEKEIDGLTIGKMGLTMEELNPEGKVDFDGTIRKVISNGRIIPQGKLVKIVEIKEGKILVMQVKRSCKKEKYKESK